MGFESVKGRGPAEDAATEVAAALQKAGHQAFFAGGCVRDHLLGLGPEDFDIATSALPEQVRSVFPRSRGVGEFFGVMLVHCNGWPIQVATFRTDGPYSDHRRPDHVAAATLEEDASRRDFTINGMYWDPIAEVLVDCYEGKADLESGIIRAIGKPEDRLKEDHLRMLRAVRFAARLSFRIEPGTAAAISAHAEAVTDISQERIGEEVRRMLLDEHRAVAATHLETLGLARSVLGQQSSTWEGARHLAALPANLTRESYALALAAWAIDRNAGMDMVPEQLVSQWRDRLMLSNGDRNGLRDLLVTWQELPGSWEGLGVAGQKRLAARPCFPSILDLYRVGAPEAAGAVSARVEELSEDGLAPEPFLRGATLLEAGFPAGPNFSRIIEAVYDAQLEGRVATPEEALACARKMWAKGDPAV